MPAVEIDALGAVGDRRFMVVDEQGRFLTQRTLPRMALIQPELRGGGLLLKAAGHGAVHVRPADRGVPPRPVAVSVWKDHGLLAEDCGAEPAGWLSAFLEVPCRLVRQGDAFRRTITRVPAAVAVQAPRQEHRVSFADAFPFLVVSEASLADLNDRLLEQGEEPVPMNRFRPNLVVSGCAPYAEDSWVRFRVRGLSFVAAGPCARCVVTTTDQRTAERAKEPLRTLATYRRDAADPTDVNFGQNVIHETKSGRLQLGDAVEVLA